MLRAGIVDPAKVVRIALQDAASIAGPMIMTEEWSARRRRKRETPAMPGGGMVAWAGWTIELTTRRGQDAQCDAFLELSRQA